MVHTGTSDWTSPRLGRCAHDGVRKGQEDTVKAEMTHRAAIHQIVDRLLLPNPVPGEVQVCERLVLREAFGHSNAALRPDAIPRQVEHLDAVIHREVVRELRDAGAADGAVAQVQLGQRRGVA